MRVVTRLRKGPFSLSIMRFGRIDRGQFGCLANLLESASPQAPNTQVHRGEISSLRSPFRVSLFRGRLNHNIKMSDAKASALIVVSYRDNVVAGFCIGVRGCGVAVLREFTLVSVRHDLHRR